MSTSTVRIIKANPFNYKNAGTNEGTHLLRVAAYARVSTDSDEQEDSFDWNAPFFALYNSFLFLEKDDAGNYILPDYLTTEQE